ncbi:MBL fold metallo-hydrolase, partial [Dichelobacter nodosus]
HIMHTGKLTCQQRANLNLNDKSRAFKRHFKSLQALWQIIAHPARFAPPQPLPVALPDWNDFFNAQHDMRFIWLGHSSLLCSSGKTTVLIDPIFARYAAPIPFIIKRFQKPPLAITELPPIDWILITHNHYDHLDKKTIRYFSKHTTKFVIPRGLENFFIRLGIQRQRIFALNHWESLTLNDITLHSVPARHYSGRHLFDHNRSLCAAYVLQTPFEKFFFSGDTAFGNGDHFRAIAARFGAFDFVFMENGQYHCAWHNHHLMPDETIAAVKILQARCWTPIHWGAYALSTHLWHESVSQTWALTQKTCLKMCTPRLGAVFSRTHESDKWW